MISLVLPLETKKSLKLYKNYVCMYITSSVEGLWLPQRYSKFKNPDSTKICVKQ